ncbi:2OG-Fe(II) oxygenase [Hyalangium sp.]|uniref:2OG-Fe(II) oxygenase n=1 Tax=Hyalangium sp. TaxID=2028555 RepID=UPI002D5DF315|nr:2OG-Fe(II) oxygenase [Hyalangium sp.]HYI00013.1 2OG-Fe(II) oxygenase [Hyalangium sp.]
MRFQPPWGGAFRLQTVVHRKPEALPVETVEAIRTTILGSPLLGESNLSSQFTGTYGFSIAFRREAVSQVTSRFPAFAPFLEAALLPDCDAFLLNPLLIQDGRGVEAHIDRSLEFYGAGTGCPVAVSVLYVQVPENLSGGELRLYHRGKRVAALAPMPRALVTFRGDVVHEVAPVSAGAPVLSTARISLVVEQYRMPAAQKAWVPLFDVRTRTGARA